MPAPKRTELEIPLDRLFFNLNNPRHEPFDTQNEVIEWLCSNEEVTQIGRDIARHGLNPLDRFGVFRDHDTEGEDATFIVGEGNRRLCALKLLTDPDLAPSERRPNFEKYAGDWAPIEELPCVIFDDLNDLDLWLKRRHHGAAGGIGQKAWNADQKSRHAGKDSRNRVALQFLDYAEREGLIATADRKRRLTTVQRFLSNPVMRETMGLETADLDNVCRNRPSDDFRLLTRQFITDMLADDPQIHSRQNSANIKAYARGLSSLQGLSHERVDPEPIAPDAEATEKPTPGPKKPKRRRKLPSDSKISEALAELGSWKLENLYHSICNVSLRGNTPLIAVGVWAFFETLTARAGRRDRTSFESFLNVARLRDRYGLGEARETKALREAVSRILHCGNTTKHHDTAATFNADQLVNDIETLNELILNIAEDAIGQQE